jgi:hypothetical protein
MEPIFVRVKPEDPSGKMRDTNAIRLNVDYMKGRGIQLSAFPATCHTDGRVIIGITQGRFATLEAADRLNRKRIEALESLVCNQLSLRTGTAWDIVQLLCSDHRLVIDDEPHAAAS